MAVPVADMDQHYRAVRGFVHRLVGNEAVAEDLTQETFLRAQRSSGAYRGEASERSWLCAIALNLVRDHFRAAKRTPATTTDGAVLERVPSDENIEQDLLKAEMSACIGGYLRQLPRAQYDVLALHDMGGLSHAEIAAVLGISTANARVLLHRGRAALRKILETHCVLSFGDDAIPCEPRPPARK